MILSSGKCAWGKCNYCGYGKLDDERLGHEELKEQIDNYFRSIDRNRVDILRVYVSGNVTDRAQVPEETQRYLVDKCEEWGIDTLLVESLPQFITDKMLEPFEGDIDIIFAIGLECYDDDLRDKLRKGFDREEFEEACELIRSRGWEVKVYLLVNPPFVEDVQEEVDRSVEYARKWADEITLINCHPHKNTALHEMYQQGEWEPLSKGEFFDVIKEHIFHPDVRYDAAQYSPFPGWKSWLPQFEEEDPIEGVGEEQLLHDAYERWQEFLCQRYEHPEEKDTVLFLPCSYTKPYTNSPLHRAIEDVLDGDENIHRVVVSSPGVVPIEFSHKYPFNNYDWQPWEETGEIMERYIDITKERVKNYLQAHSYERHLCYFRHDAESYTAVEEACKELDIDLQQCLRKETFNEVKEEDNPLTLDRALKDLQKSIHERAIPA